MKLKKFKIQLPLAVFFLETTPSYRKHDIALKQNFLFVVERNFSKSTLSEEEDKQVILLLLARSNLQH